MPSICYTPPTPKDNVIVNDAVDCKFRGIAAVKGCCSQVAVKAQCFDSCGVYPRELKSSCWLNDNKPAANSALHPSEVSE